LFVQVPASPIAVPDVGVLGERRRSELILIEQPSRGLVHRQITKVHTHHEPQTPSLRFPNHVQCFFQIFGQGFLSQHVQASLVGHHGLLVMDPRWRGQQYRISLDGPQGLRQAFKTRQPVR
jgi:hypothetical protein